MRFGDRGSQRGAPRRPGGFRVNEDIRVRQVRLVDAEGHMVGIVPTEEAMALAREKDFDLVEVSPNADPPVCKVLDYGKFKYEQKKREHEAKRKQRGGDFKEVRLRPKTGKHDRDIKLDRARRFLGVGDRVQITVLLRGREMQRIDIANQILADIAKELEDVAKVERRPAREGRRVHMSLMPKVKPKPAPKKQASSGPAAPESASSAAPSSGPAASESASSGASSSGPVRDAGGDAGETTNPPDAAGPPG